MISLCAYDIFFLAVAFPLMLMQNFRLIGLGENAYVYVVRRMVKKKNIRVLDPKKPEFRNVIQRQWTRDDSCISGGASHVVLWIIHAYQEELVYVTYLSITHLLFFFFCLDVHRNFTGERTKMQVMFETCDCFVVQRGIFLYVSVAFDGYLWCLSSIGGWISRTRLSWVVLFFFSFLKQHYHELNLFWIYI